MMSLPAPLSRRPFRFAAGSRGAVLIVVLAMLLLITIMVLTFFADVAGEYESAQTESEVETTRHLADASVQIVMGQIRAGTSQAGATWASQPGMIRTYGDDGRPQKVYALYSGREMIRTVGAGGFSPSIDLPPEGWNSDPARWVDLNFPSQASDGRVVFPILDPRAAAASGSNPSLVEGFTFTPASVDGAAMPASVTDENARLPMPVRWIYVLKDGQLAAPSEGSGNKVTFSAPGPVPSAENPIVGRIAFWADDETCKININTACGGVPWDTPIGNSGLELLLARFQPAKNEFSRYPGHPATVSLTPVLWSALGMASPGDTVWPSFVPDMDTRNVMKTEPSLTAVGQAFRDKLFPFVPRNTFGGSQMSTVAAASVMSGGGALAAVDSDRLFASFDELLYGFNNTNAGRASNPLGLTTADVARWKFFLTSESRSPELNPFNLPKICLWPLPDSARKSVSNSNALAGDTRSPLDRLIAFCGTLSYEKAAKKREYAFTRYDSTSATNDFLATDAAGTAGNQILYNYLETLMGRSLPGFGGSFSARYGTGGTRQILTGVYDFIRSQINLLDTARSTSNPTDTQNLDGRYVTRYAYSANITAGTLDGGGLTGNVGQVVPASLSNGTRGSGRYPVISQVAVEFIARAANQPPVTGNLMHPWIPSGASLAAYPTIDITKASGSGAVAAAHDASRPNDFHTHPGLRFLTLPDAGGGYNLPNPRYRGPALADYQTQIEPALLVSFSLPGAGLPGYRDRFKIRISALENLEAGGTSLFPATVRTTTVDLSTLVCGYNLGPDILYASQAAASQVISGIPLVVGPGSDNGRTFPFAGGRIKIELLNNTDNSVVQTYNLEFPAASLPTPLLPNPTQGDNRNVDAHSFWTQPPSAPFIKPSFPPTKSLDLPPSSFLTFDQASQESTAPNYALGGRVSGYASGKTRYSSGAGVGFANVFLPQWPSGTDYRGKLSSDTVRALEAPFGDTRILTQLSTVPSDIFLPHRFYFDTRMRSAHSFRNKQHESHFEAMHAATLQYLTASSHSAASTIKTYGGGAWDATDPNPGNLWDVATGEDVQHITYSMFVAGASTNTVADKWPFTASTCEFDPVKFSAYKSSSPTLSGIPEFPSLWERGGDFNSGFPGFMDGPLLGKVDEGNNRVITRGIYPYYNDLAQTTIVPVGPNLFSPNRQVASPVVLGSIPSGYKSSFDPASPRLADLTPWRTLLFSPNPVGTAHEALGEMSLGGVVPASGKAPDFILLDFFWMPVVEPYAISEPLSTAGKVNMNAQIAPFTYITRNTALRGALRSTMLTAVPDKWLNNKNASGSGAAILADVDPAGSPAINYANFRYPIQVDETLKQFDVRFSNGDLFRSPSEICSLWLYPGKRGGGDSSMPAWDASGTAIRNWWYANPGTESKSVTGDNLREKPYAALYPLLTTKSNTYTVHFKVQTLKKVIGTDRAGWDENRDRVTGEMQGSQMIERYIDASDPNLPDFATKAGAGDPTLVNYYRFRILNNKRFTP